MKATKSSLAYDVLGGIVALYRIEADIRGRPPDQRLRVRTERTAPLMAALHDWLETMRSPISGPSEAAERAMRPIAVGRRNWTFAGSDPGGEQHIQPHRDGEAARSRPRDIPAPRAASRVTPSRCAELVG